MLGLLAQAREEQAVRRGRRLMPRPAPEPDAVVEPPARKRQNHDRRGAALKGWQTRYGRRRQDHAWMSRKPDE